MKKCNLVEINSLTVFTHIATNIADWFKSFADKSVLLFLIYILFPFDANASIKIFVTDWGISQYRDKLKTGDPFINTNISVFPNLSTDSQVCIVMPPKEKMLKMTDIEMENDIYEILKSRIDHGLEKKLGTFELQIIQHIGTLTYFFDSDQYAVNRFARCAYKAIGRLDIHLQNECQDVSFYGIFGSNGTKSFSENIDSWKSYMKSAILIDGRGFYSQVEKVIKTIGPQNVAIYNTAGDFPAENFFFVKSIGNHDVVKILKRKYNSLTVGWIDPIDRLDFIGHGHVAAMESSPTIRFLVKYFNGKNYSIPEKMSSAQILNVLSHRYDTPSTSQDGLGATDGICIPRVTDGTTGNGSTTIKRDKESVQNAEKRDKDSKIWHSGPGGGGSGGLPEKESIKGVYMNSTISSINIMPNQQSKLKTFVKQTTKSRPSQNALSWPANDQ